MKYQRRLLITVLLSLVMIPGVLFAELSGDAILVKADAILESPATMMEITLTTSDVNNIEKSSRMLVYLKKDPAGLKRTLIQYLAPEEDQGTKFLSLGQADQMWMYLPRIHKSIRIAGEMIKQSIMNTDFSYEDLLDRVKLSEYYAAQLLGEETVGDAGCYVLELKAKKGSAHYRQIKLWVRRDNFIPIKEEFYSGSGKMVKTAVQTDIVKIHGRLVPTRIIFRDLEQNGHQTVLKMSNMRFGIVIPERYFSVAYLEKDK